MMCQVICLLFMLTMEKTTGRGNAMGRKRYIDAVFDWHWRKELHNHSPTTMLRYNRWLCRGHLISSYICRYLLMHI